MIGAQRHRLRHRPGRPHPPGTGLRPRPGHRGHQVLVRRGADRRRPPAAGALMKRPGRRRPPPRVALAAAMLAAGLRQRARPAPPARRPRPPPPAPSLDTSLVTAAGTWAVAVMGGSVAQDNNFWQLFIRPAGSTRWKLVTPPGTADNGGLVLAGGGPVTDHRVPAQPVPHLHAADHHPRRRPGLVIGRPARRGPGRRPRRPGRRARQRAPARPARRRHGRAGRTRLHQLDAPWPAQQSLAATPGRPALRAAGPHRRRLHPRRASRCSPAPAPAPEPPASSPPERNLAGSRARAARRPGRPGHHGTPADPDRTAA